MFLRLTNIGKL